MGELIDMFIDVYKAGKTFHAVNTKLKQENPSLETYWN